MPGPTGIAVEKVAKTVARISLTAESGKDLEYWLLLRSDAHHDNALCRRDIEKRDLDQARERGAGIIDLGDALDLMQSKGDPRSDRSQLRSENLANAYFDSVVDEAAAFYEPYAMSWLFMSPGNHECVDPQTEVLTRAGWIPVAAVTTSDEVACLHPLTKLAYFVQPLKTHSYQYSGPMIKIRSRLVDMLVTPNHRIAYFSQKANELCYRFAGTLPNTGAELNIPTGGLQDIEGDYPLDDDLIRLSAWLLTDGTVNRGYSIFQSKREMVDRIKRLLDRLMIPYTFHRRERSVREVMGKRLKNPPMQQCEFYLLKEGHGKVDALGIESKERLPDWVWGLSKRQFDMFLEEVILGDGTRHKHHPDCPEVFGKEPFLSSLQAACVCYGYRATLSSGVRENGAKYWVLHVANRSDVTSHGHQFSEIDYEGPVYCLTTPAGNFFMRRNGRVCVTGNSAVLDRHGTSVTDRLADQLRWRTNRKSPVTVGTYQGWIQVKFEWGTRHRQTFNIRYTHGYGGGGPVTKDVIQANRQLAYTENADFLISGHVHESWHMIQPREYLDNLGQPKLREVSIIKLGTYKDEFTGGQGWAVGKGMPPKPMGGWWVHFTQRDHQIHYKVIRTDGL